jgi:hypothetical protein
LARLAAGLRASCMRQAAASLQWRTAEAQHTTKKGWTYQGSQVIPSCRLVCVWHL